MRCYLSCRYQLVSIDGTKSAILPVTSGVPKGSILGPLLFLIYLNDLSTCLSISTLLQFVDHCKCISRIPSTRDRVCFQIDMNSLYSWSNEWHLSFKVSKCKELHFASTRHSAPSCHYCIDDVLIEWVSHFRDLGITFSNNLSWSHHYKSIASNALKSLCLLRHVMSTCHSLSTKLHMYTSLARYKLSYCSQVWRPPLTKDIVYLERIQHKSTKFILNYFESSYRFRLVKVNLFPLSL